MLREVMQTPLEEFKKQTKKSSKSKKEQLDSLKQQKREPPQPGRQNESSKRKAEADFEKQANIIQKKASKRKSAIQTFFGNSIA
jgi:hypothetical protein